MYDAVPGDPSPVTVSTCHATGPGTDGRWRHAGDGTGVDIVRLGPRGATPRR